MALFAIGDTHLSLSANKPMDVFGGGWTGYVDKLSAGFRALVAPEDTVVIAGDVSWGMSLEEAEKDFAFLDALPGKKLLLKGNHDYWWTTVSKMTRFFAEHGFTTLEILHNNCHFYGETALCGTRGWFYEEDQNGHNEKVFNRELIRLEASLKAAGERPKLVFLHYPPRYRGYECPEILDLLKRYEVRRCFYGHLHGGSHAGPVPGRLLSALSRRQLRPDGSLPQRQRHLSDPDAAQQFFRCAAVPGHGQRRGGKLLLLFPAAFLQSLPQRSLAGDPLNPTPAALFPRIFNKKFKQTALEAA